MVSPHLQRKARLLHRLGMVHKVSDTEWRVDSMSSGDVHTVKFQSCGGSCTCKGFQYGKWCSHIEAVRLQHGTAELIFPLQEELL